MTSHFNLPPGVSPTDIPGNDPDECPTCEGYGTIEQEQLNSMPPQYKSITCPTCGGLGVVNTRTKGAQDAD